jgi:hypothetical protein
MTVELIDRNRQGGSLKDKCKNQNVKCKIKEVIRRRRIPQFLVLIFNFYIFEAIQLRIEIQQIG